MVHIAVPPILHSHSSFPVCCIPISSWSGDIVDSSLLDHLQLLPCGHNAWTLECQQNKPWATVVLYLLSSKGQTLSSDTSVRFCWSFPVVPVSSISSGPRHSHGISHTASHTQCSLGGSCRLRAEPDQLEIARSQPPAAHYRETVEVQQLPFRILLTEDLGSLDVAASRCSSGGGVITRCVTENFTVN